MAAGFILLCLFLIHKSSSQTITYQDISCNNTYTATVPVNATQYFRFSVPTTTTNAVQIDFCQSTYDTVAEVYKYVNDSAYNYNIYYGGDHGAYINKNDDWYSGCTAGTSSHVSYFQLSPFTYRDVTNYTGYYILKLYDYSNVFSNNGTNVEYTLKFTCNAIQTKLPVDGVLNCNDKQSISGNLAEGQWNLIQINPPLSFAKANFTFNPGFTLDACNTNFGAHYKLISWSLSEACCMNYIGDSMCTANQWSNGGKYLTYRKSDTDMAKYYYLNVSAYSHGHYDIQYSCDIVPTASPTQAPTLIGGSVVCGETISGIIVNGETYSYSFDVPSYANMSKSVSFIGCNSKYDNSNEGISMNVNRPDGNSVGSSISGYQEYYNYCGTHDDAASFQLYPDVQYNNRTGWNLQVTKSQWHPSSQPVTYNITYVCEDIEPATPSPTSVNYTYPTTTPVTFPFNISMNITRCGQELTGVLDSYSPFNVSQPGVFGFNLYYWYANKYYVAKGPFTINPCNTEYPLDIVVLAMDNWPNSNYSPPITKMGKCANGYNDILSWSPDFSVYGVQYIIGWIGTNRSSDKVIYDDTDGAYSVLFDCAPPNISIPITFTANITQCGQQLSGKLDTYYNESDNAIIAKFYRLDLDYLVKKHILDEDNSYTFIIDPCNTEYPLDIKVGSLTNLMYGRPNTLLQTTMRSKCSNGYNYKLSLTTNVSVYGSEYIVAWEGLNTSNAQAIFDMTDGSYEVDFMCSSVTTANPTTNPTIPGYTYPPTTTGTGQSAGDTGDNKSGLDAVPSYVWLILVIIFGVLFVTFLLLWYRKKKQLDTANEDMSTPYVQLTDETDNRKL